MQRVVEQVQGPEAAEPGNTVQLEEACVLQVLGESTLVAQEQLMGEALDRRAVAACAFAERRNRVGAGVPGAGCMARLGAVADARGAPRRCPLLRACAACVRVSIHVLVSQGIEHRRTSRTAGSTILLMSSAWNSAYPSCGCATSSARACSGCVIMNA